MRWPWVSRAEYDSVCEGGADHNRRANIAEADAEKARRQLTELQRRYDALAAEQNHTKRRAIRIEKRYDALVTEVLALKKEGYATPETHPVVTIPPMQPLRTPPKILLDAAKAISPVKDKTFEYNLALIYQHEDDWSDEAKVRDLAHNIRHGSRAD